MVLGFNNEHLAFCFVVYEHPPHDCVSKGQGALMGLFTHKHTLHTVLKQLCCNQSDQWVTGASA